jgi:serine/threonine protein kinase
VTAGGDSRALDPGDPTRVGRYHVLRRLGAGGMSVVYCGYDPDLDRQVAIKLLLSEHPAHGTAEARARLQREARAMARVSHPNVVPVYDVGLHGEDVYIAMELVQGQSMRAWLGETARPWNEIVGMFMQAGRGLAAAHDAGLVHRDFKPENVLIGDDGRARVVDFGLARPTPLDDRLGDVLLGEPDGDPEPEDTSVDMPIGSDVSTTYGSRGEAVTTTGIVTGTPAYMSPEQHLAQDATPSSDQFAFAVALWEGLYLQRPFPGKTAFAIADAVIEGRVSPTPKKTRVPKWMRNILLRGLAVEPQDRYPSMKALLAAMVFTSKIMQP